MYDYSFNLPTHALSIDRNENSADSLDIISRQDTEKVHTGPMC